MPPHPTIHSVSNPLPGPAAGRRQRGQHQFAWFADADSARPVRVDSALRGLRRLWTEQLRQLSAGSLEAAQAVAEAYPSPQALLQVRVQLGEGSVGGNSGAGLGKLWFA